MNSTNILVIWSLASAIGAYMIGALINRRRAVLLTQENVLLSKQFSVLEGKLAQLDQMHAAKLDIFRADNLVKQAAAEIEAFKEGERQERIRLEKQQQSFSIQVRPYVSKILDEGIFSTKVSVKVGYQHQLFICGIPCFDPHLAIEQEYETKKIDEEKIERLTLKALKLAEAAISAKPGPVRALISLIRNPILVGK